MRAHTATPWHSVERWPQPEIRAGDTTIADIRDNGHNQERGQANAALIVRAVNAHEAPVEALKPFAAVAERDIGDTESDADLFRPMEHYNHAPRLTVGDLRRALAALRLASPTAEGGERG